MFEFKIKHKDKNSLARSAIFSTPHGKIHTPVFMPVGTKGTVKTLSPDDLKKLTSEIILANTYHLYLRPGEKVVKKSKGLHRWISWDRPILTDSGGFQVFSLAQQKDHNRNKEFKTTVKIDENGVEFKSHIDGSKHYFTPEKAIQIQHDLGADIIMAFDECAQATSTKAYFEKAMTRTHNWLVRCKKEHEKLSKKQVTPQALFGIVQGGLYKDLRTKSAQFIDSQNLPGSAIGGLSVGESKAKMYEILETVIPHLSQGKPRYLMGVGTPEDLLEGIERGVDMFDCVHPTRMARHGAFWTENGRFNIKGEKFKTDYSALQKGCTCETCKSYSKSYLRHLIIEGEILGLKLMTIHNLHFLLNLMQLCRTNIEKNNFGKFKKDFLKKFKSKKMKNHESIERAVEKQLQQKDKKNRPKMHISGRGVFNLKKLIAEKNDRISKGKNPKKSR